MRGQGKELSTDAGRLSIREACAWYARLSSETADSTDRDCWHGWLNSDPLHRQAWQRIEAINQKLLGVPGSLVEPLMRSAEPSRRQLLGSLCVIAGAGSLGWLGYRSDVWQDWRADYRTAIGERRRFELADSSSLILNTHSAVQVEFSDTQRQLYLRSGEIIVSTAKDSLAASRPFRVKTRHGMIEALGTRFSVRVEDDHTQVAVLDKTVAITPLAATGQRKLLNAGEHLSFDRSMWQEPSANTVGTVSWEQGSLIALDMPLGELLDELGRYRPGVLRCDPALKMLKISGVFPLNDTDQALTALQNGFSLRLVYRTRYWVTVAALS